MKSLVVLTAKEICLEVLVKTFSILTNDASIIIHSTFKKKGGHND